MQTAVVNDCKEYTTDLFSDYESLKKNRCQEAELHVPSFASSRKVGCIQAGASLRSFSSSWRWSVDRVRFRRATRAEEERENGDEPGQL
jgi:hypothetical protein